MPNEENDLNDYPYPPPSTSDHTPTPTPEDLANLSSSIPDSDLSSVSQEIKHEKRRKFLDLVGKAIGSMLGDSLPEDQREALAEGYSEMLSGMIPNEPPMLKDVQFMVPAIKPNPLPPSVFTNQQLSPMPCLVTVDFFCLLSRTIEQIIHLPVGSEPPTATLRLTHGEVVNLDGTQTKALICYIAAITEHQNSQPPSYFGPVSRSGVDQPFLEHPSIKTILEEKD